MVTRHRIDDRRLTSATQFAAQLANALHELRITHQQLASDLGITRYTVDSWTRAANPSLPSTENLAQLCLWLECRSPGLSRQIVATAGVAMPARSSPPPTHGAARSGLLSANTSFIGRAAALAELQELLPNTRLLSLTGRRGIGKTRLALRLVEELLTGYSDGVYVVELSSIATAAQVPQALARILAVSERPGQSLVEVLVDHLRGRELLLLLDSCEHVREMVATLAARLLLACPRLTIMTTSCEPLGLLSERVWRVPALELPAPNLRDRQALGRSDAVRLFLARALHARHSLIVDDTSALLIAAICRRLDGLPLAIELAAAWAGALDLEAIASRLGEH